MMSDYIKSLGYKFTEIKDTLNPMEFMLVSTSKTLDEVLTTFSKQAFETTEVYQLFIATRFFNQARVEALLDTGSQNEVIAGTAEVETQERGYLITLTYIVKD